MIKRTITYSPGTEQQGLTVEDYLKSSGYSHRLIIQLKKAENGLLLDGNPVFTTARLRPGSRLTVNLSEDEDSPNILPVDIPLSIIYEDADILVVDKAAGMPIHPSQGHYDNTLANAVAWYYRQKGEPYVYRAVSRLDRDTSGLLVLAKHMLSACVLSGQMSGRTIRRRYLALVRGRTPESGTIDAPIGRVRGSVIERFVDQAHGERAVTHYRRLDYNPDRDLSLVGLRLETGRTHQIRVHMAYIGHPLPGDFLYNPDYGQISRPSIPAVWNSPIRSPGPPWPFARPCLLTWRGFSHPAQTFGIMIFKRGTRQLGPAQAVAAHAYQRPALGAVLGDIYQL